MYELKKIFILGMARSGYEAAKFLSGHNCDITITDMKEQDETQVKELKALGVNYIITDKPEELLNDSFDCLIKNPGIRRDHVAVVKARDELKIPVINEVEAAYPFISKNVKIIGITGSNGKTTTTTMIHEIMKKAELPVHLGGNIGFPVTSLVNTLNDNDILLLEISDHQLVDMYDFKTNISVLTNISQVHLDFHRDFDQYKEMKKKIFNHHTEADLAILNGNDKEVELLTNDIKSKKEYFQTGICQIKNKAIYYGEEEIIKLNDIAVRGMHNYENIMAAIMVVKQFNVSNEAIVDVLKTFPGVEHRLEYVTTIDDVKYYNDAKATNTESTIIALSSFENNTILLLGGLDRGHSFDPLIPYLNNTKLILCYGETKERILAFAKENNIEAVAFETLKEATNYAKDKAVSGDVVLLSPACASWDQYKCFEDRGEDFKKCVNEK